MCIIEQLEKDKELCIEYMLQNKKIESALNKWKRKSKDGDLMMEAFKCMARRDKEQGGLILSVKNDDIPVGADSVDFFMIEKHPKIEMHYAEDKKGSYYAMASTSKKHFKKCNDTSGLVMFIGNIFTVIERMEEVNGLVLNLGRQEIVFDKIMIRAVLQFIQMEKYCTGHRK